MTLSEYMAQTGLTDTQLAEAVGRDRSQVNRWRRGEATPALAVILHIERLTGGKVSPGDWIGPPREDAAA